ncbi:BTB/POZ domain-containing protein 17-like [Ptychodera flava]|uniref:BTB/POZ domain-containing protein 17-like n=1 Tax=Ptychodera flava TaxID=63121 RepID=UPI00396A7231
MLMSDKWKDADQGEIQLEDTQCEAVFGQFLEYLYTGKVHITTDKAVPLLILADKYNVPELKESCGAFMMRHLVTSPGNNHVLSWYQYAKTCGHHDLQESCNQFIEWNIDTIIGSPDWEMMDRDQLMSLLRSSDIVVKSEYSLYCALELWLTHASRAEYLEENLQDLLPLIRFPVMTPQQLINLEGHSLVQDHPNIFEKHFKRAFRFHAVPVDLRSEEHFSRSRVYEFRNYTGADHKIAASIIIQNYSSTSGNLNRVRHKQSLHTVISGSNADSHDTLHWEMTFYPKGFYRTADGFVVERNNAVRFLITLQNGKPIDMDIIHVVYSHQNKVTFVKDILYHSHSFSSNNVFQIENLLPFDDLRSQNSPYLIENSLKIQVILKPKIMVKNDGIQNSVENSL